VVLVLGAIGVVGLGKFLLDVNELRKERARKRQALEDPSYLWSTDQPKTQDAGDDWKFLSPPSR
jgi:hypothetical protein